MSSNRKRAAIHKANTEADWARQRMMLTEHHYTILKSFTEQLALHADALQAKIDRLMFEYCPDEMTPEQIKKWEESQAVCEDES